MGKQSQTPEQLFDKLNKKFCLDREDSEILTQEYKARFDNIPERHIYSLVTLINSMIVVNFSPIEYKTPQEKENIARVIKNVANCTLEDRQNTPERVNTLYWLNNRFEKVCQYLEKDDLTPIENPEAYLPLVNAITKERGELIGNTVLSTISNVEKYANQDSTKKHNPEREEKSLTWVEKVTVKDDLPRALK